MRRTVSYRELCAEALRLERLAEDHGYALSIAERLPVSPETRRQVAQSIVGPCGTVDDGPERGDMPVIEWPDTPEGLLL